MLLANTDCLAVIPARGGSKRVPGKNIREFCGKPMIVWSIEAARRSGVFNMIVVSTDSREIAEIASRSGAEVPFVRPADLADDHATTAEVMQHAIQWAVGNGYAGQLACCVYATAPMLDSSDLVTGLETIQTGQWKYVFSAAEYSAPVYRSFRDAGDGGVRMLFPEHLHTRSQDLPAVLHDAAQFYWGTVQAWLDKAPIIGASSTTVLIPSSRVQDIDSLNDWDMAEKLFRLGLALPGVPTPHAEE